MVYQDFALAGNMPIYENIYLGREPGRKFGPPHHRRPFASRRQMAAEHLDRLQIHVKSRRPEQSRNSPAGSARRSPSPAPPPSTRKLVIMDEPTAALAIKEVGKVLDLIKSLKRPRRGGDHHLAPHGRHLLLLRPGHGALPGHQFRRIAARTTTNRNEVIGWIMGTKGHTDSLAHDKVH